MSPPGGFTAPVHHTADRGGRSKRIRHKPVREQVIVITGASSGIGLATARADARRGARVVLAARNGAALDDIAYDIRERGGEARGTSMSAAAAR